MPVLGTLQQSKKIAGPAQVYIVAYPTGGYAGATDALRVTAMKALFFSDSATDACRVLIPSIYSDIDATGIEIKLKQPGIEFDPNIGSKYKAANAPSEASISWSFKDVDANKLMDAFSAIAADTLTTVAAAGVAGRKTVQLGRQGTPLAVAIMVRYPSEFQSAGGVQEFRHIYMPMANMSPDWTIKLDKKSVAVVKVSATGICDMSLIGNQAMPPIVLIDDVTAAGT